MIKMIPAAMITLVVLTSEAPAQSRSNDDFVSVIKNNEAATIKSDRGDTATWAEAHSI